MIAQIYRTGWTTPEDVQLLRANPNQAGAWELTGTVPDDYHRVLDICEFKLKKIGIELFLPAG